MSKLLVIIPFYNVEKYLQGAIESILQQTYKNIKLVLVDDCSTDNSFEVAKSYESHPKVTILQNKENKGCYYSLNKALNYSKNQEWDYWHFHGADDLSDITRFEKIISFLEKNPKMIGCKSTFIRVHYDTKEIDILNETGQLHIATSEGIAFYSRKAFDILGYYDNTRFSGDTDYFWRLDAWIKINNLDYKLGEHKDPLYIAYLHNINLTRIYDFHTTRPQYWRKIQNEIKTVMIPNNNFYREIFE